MGQITVPILPSHIDGVAVDEFKVHGTTGCEIITAMAFE